MGTSNLKARLVESRLIGPDVRHFVFEAPDCDRLEFLPGQFVSFSGLVGGRRITRAYSIASAPDGNRFDLCLNLVKDGRFSPHLFEMAPGDEVDMKGPLGMFVPRTPFRDSVFVATGTGIAPFRAMLGSPPVQASNSDVLLLFGARYEAGLVYGAEFEELVSHWEGFRYWPTITRPGADWRGRTGRVQEHLDEALGGRTGVDVYICGLKEMVDSIRDTLKAKGFDRKQIIYEKYD